MQLNIHKKEPYLMSMSLLDYIDKTGVFKYIFQNKITKLIMLFILLADVFLRKTKLKWCIKVSSTQNVLICVPSISI